MLGVTGWEHFGVREYCGPHPLAPSLPQWDVDIRWPGLDPLELDDHRDLFQTYVNNYDRFCQYTEDFRSSSKCSRGSLSPLSDEDRVGSDRNRTFRAACVRRNVKVKPANDVMHRRCGQVSTFRRHSEKEQRTPTLHNQNRCTQSTEDNSCPRLQLSTTAETRSRISSGMSSIYASDNLDRSASVGWPHGLSVESGLGTSSNMSSPRPLDVCDVNGNAVTVETEHTALIKRPDLTLNVHHPINNNWCIPETLSRESDQRDTPALSNTHMKALSCSNSPLSFSTTNSLCSNRKNNVNSGRGLSDLSIEKGENNFNRQKTFTANVVESEKWLTNRTKSEKNNKEQKPFSSRSPVQQKMAPIQTTVTKPVRQRALCPGCDASMKIVLLGDYGVGKSQLLNAFSRTLQQGKGGFHRAAFRPSELLELTANKAGRNVRIKMLDTAGQERYRSLTSSFFRGVQGCLLVFNMTRKESFDNIMQWYSDMQRYSDVTTILLVGVITPYQSRDAREVTSERAFKLADSLQTQYLETTMEDEEMLVWIVERMVEEVSRQMPAVSSSYDMITILPSHRRHKAQRRRKFVACAS